MAKATVLQTIRRQGAQRRALNHISKHHSAYSRMSKANHELSHGSSRRDQFDDDHDGEAALEQVRVPARRPTRIGTFSSASVQKRRGSSKAKAKAKAQPTTPRAARAPEAPKIEYWPQAEGKTTQKGTPEKVTCTLGIARVPNWTLASFEAALEKVIMQLGAEPGDLLVAEVELGPEVMTDVFLDYMSKEQARAAKAKLDGKMVEDRMLQLHFSQD